MNYIKAKFLKGDKPSGRAYTYSSEEKLNPGDIVTDAKGSKLLVVDEPVDMAWVETYGADKVAVVKKYVEPARKYCIVDILDSKTKETRTDGRYPLRIGRICKKPKVVVTEPMSVEYIANADGSDYSNRFLRTSRVVDVYETDEKLEIETMNSIYIFEPVDAGESGE